ncbi:MAG: hypothetical protein RR873_07465 [Christensenella sp.]
MFFIRNAEHFGSRELASLRVLGRSPEVLVFKGAGGWYPPLQGRGYPSAKAFECLDL